MFLSVVFSVAVVAKNIHKTVDIFYMCNMGLLNVVVSKVYKGLWLV